MTYSSSLSSDPMPLVLDTSVLINIHASSHGDSILMAIPNEILIPEIVAAELRQETCRENGEYQLIHELASEGKLKITDLDEHEYEVYAQLVSGASSLDDGEAATIAICACRQFRPVIDERKGRKEAEKRCLGASPAWSLDVVQHPSVIDTLGQLESANALFLALRDGRMRIHEDHCNHVVDLIGIQRALECRSLPGFKARRQEWLRG